MIHWYQVRIHLLASKAVDIRVVRDTVTEDQSQSHVGSPTANNGEIIVCNLGVYSTPSISRTNGCDLSISQKCGFIHTLKGNSNASFNAGGTRIGSVAATLDREGTLCKTREQYDRGNID